jgi:hypothetical protein
VRREDKMCGDNLLLTWLLLFIITASPGGFSRTIGYSGIGESGNEGSDSGIQNLRED